MRKLLLFLLLFASNFSHAQSGNLAFNIDGYGNIDCNVNINLDTIHSSENRVVSILLPFKIDDDLQLEIPDDLIYSFKIISKKYTLITIYVDKNITELNYKIQSINNYAQTVEGKAKIEVDYNYKDIPATIKKLCNEKKVFFQFNIKWITPKKLSDEEVSFFPREAIQRDSTNSFSIAYEKLKRDDKNAWFVYPNFKTNNDQQLQFYFLLLIGILTGLVHLNPIYERKEKVIRLQAGIGVLIIIVFTVLYFILPKTSFIVIKLVAAPILPHVVILIIGILYLKFTTKNLWKISGMIKDESNEPISYADILLYAGDQDLKDPKKKPLKKLFELNNGRFEFTIYNRKSKSYKIQVCKPDRITEEIEIPNDRAKSYDLPQAIILKRK